MKWNKSVLLFLVVSVLIYTVVQLLISTGKLDLYYSNLLLSMGINIILAVSLHLIIGITGQFSIGHAGFLAVGAYISAIFTMKLGLPFLLAIFAGGIAALLAGLLVGVPSLRLKGDYLAIATLGFGEIVRIIFLNINYVGGAAGMQVTHMTNWLSVFLATIVTILVVHNFTQSAHGRACLAVRENEIAAEAMGINITYYKVLAFAIGAFFAGIAGALYAHNFYVIQPGNFGFLKSFDILIFVVLGGLGSLTGSIISASFLTVVSTVLQQYPETRMILYSLVLILVMLYRPQGLMGNKEITDILPFRKQQKGVN